MSVLHFVPGLHYKDGGPSLSVVRLTDSLASDKSLSVTLASHADPRLQSIPSSSTLVSRKTENSSRQWALKLGLVDRKLLLSTFASQQVDLLHTHCLWHPANHWAMRVAKQYDVPLICQPRGMLDPWALSYKAWKKRMALLIFQRKDLKHYRAFIATSGMEVESIRRFGLRQPVALIPNGVDMPLRDPNLVREAVQRDRVVLFLSRIHPKKGILALVEAWANLRKTRLEASSGGPSRREISGGRISASKTAWHFQQHRVCRRVAGGSQGISISCGRSVRAPLIRRKFRHGGGRGSFIRRSGDHYARHTVAGTGDAGLRMVDRHRRGTIGPGLEGSDKSVGRCSFRNGEAG